MNLQLKTLKLPIGNFRRASDGGKMLSFLHLLRKSIWDLVLVARMELMSRLRAGTNALQVGWIKLQISISPERVGEKTGCLAFIGISRPYFATNKIGFRGAKLEINSKTGSTFSRGSLFVNED